MSRLQRILASLPPCSLLLNLTCKCLLLISMIRCDLPLVVCCVQSRCPKPALVRLVALQSLNL